MCVVLCGFVSVGPESVFRRPSLAHFNGKMAERRSVRIEWTESFITSGHMSGNSFYLEQQCMTLPCRSIVNRIVKAF